MDARRIPSSADQHHECCLDSARVFAHSADPSSHSDSICRGDLEQYSTYSICGYLFSLRCNIECDVLLLFGLLDLKSCTLPRAQKSYYSCNVCNALASNFGRASRVMLTNDSVYLSLLIGSQRMDIPYSYGKLTRSCQPWSKSAIRLPDFEYPAAVSIVIRGVKLLDDRHDEGSFRSRALTALQWSGIKKAEYKLREFGLHIPPVETLVEEQHRREAVAGRELDYYSEITEQLHSEIFSQTAILAGAPTNFNNLADVGSHLGRIAYLLDSYIDFQNDRGKGSFNPCNQLLVGYGNRSRRQLFMRYVNQSLRAIRESVAKVELYRFEETVRYVVTDGLQAKVKNFLSGTKCMARPVMYSVAPVVLLAILRNVLTSSSSGDDCCDCCLSEECDGGGGTGYTTTTTTQASYGPPIVDRLTEGATGGAIGGGGGILINEIASRIRGRSAPPPEETPTEEPTPPSPEQELEELEGKELEELDREAERELEQEDETPPEELPDGMKLPPGVPKVDIKPPEEPPEDGVKVAELPPDHPVRKAFEDRFGRDFDLSQKLTEFWERVKGSEETEEEAEETPTEEPPIKIPPHMIPDEFVDKVTETTILGPGDQRTPEEKAAQEEADRAGGEKAKDAVYGSGSKLSQEARDRAIPGFGDTSTFIDQINAERAEQPGSEAVRVVRQAEKLKTAVGDHGVEQRDWSGVPDAVYDRGSEYTKVYADVKDWMKMVGQDIAYDKTGHEAMDQFINQYGHAADSSNVNDVDNFRRIYENLRGK